MLFYPGHECNTNLSVSADVYLSQQNIPRGVTVATCRERPGAMHLKGTQTTILLVQTVVLPIKQSMH